MALRTGAQRVAGAALAAAASQRAAAHAVRVVAASSATSSGARNLSLLSKLFGRGNQATPEKPTAAQEAAKQQGTSKPPPPPSSDSAEGAEAPPKGDTAGSDPLRSAAAQAQEAISRAKDVLGKPDVAALTRAFEEARRDLLESSNAAMYSGWATPETRQKYRQLKKSEYELEVASRAAYAKLMEENPDAGASVVLHKDSTLSQAWKKFKDSNSFMQNLDTLRTKYENSDNLLAVYMHRLHDSIVNIFAETEHAQVLREVRIIDPTFDLQRWLREVQQYIVPEVLDAFARGDLETLRLWCSDGPYSVLKMTIDERNSQGLVVDTKIMDLRDVDLAMARMIDNRPVLVVSFVTYQVTMVRDATGAVVEGKEDAIERVGYVMALYREPDRHPVTGGWKVIEVGIQSASAAF